MEQSKQTAWMVSRLLYEPHIYHALSDEYKDVYMAHELLQEIEFGYRIVIGVFATNNNFIGCVHGVLDNGIFTCHLLFKRKINVLPLLFECEMKLKEYCSQQKIKIDFIDGFIAQSNIAACRIARKFGSVCLGKDNNTFVLHNNNKEFCWHFRKEMK